jgi:hypothetical protein
VKCTKCGGEIRLGEKYKAILSQTEQFGRRSIIGRRTDSTTILSTESEEYYHQACAPEGN